MATLLESYYSVTDSLGESAISFFNEGQFTSPPTKDWPLAHFGSALAIVGIYLGFVVIGSAVMQAHKTGYSKSLYGIRFAYNLLQMILCSYMAMEAIFIPYRQGYSLACNEFVRSEDAPLAKLLWLFYMSKILDFMDTFFIIMGKKWKQLSFLHVYHHTTIFLFYWLNVNLNYDGDIYLTIVLNGLIHAMMYTYYFVSLHTTEIWWKSFLTLGQMFQFCCMITQALYLVTSNCDQSPVRVTYLYCVYIITLLFLFAQFFVTSYTKKPKKHGKPHKE